MYTRSNKAPVVIYHRDCLDGFTAAYVADTALRSIYSQAPILISDTYTTGLCSKSINQWLVDVEERDIFIVDFSYPVEVLRELVAVANHVTVIDHHASPIKKLQESFGLSILEKSVDAPVEVNAQLTLYLNLAYSGCELTWKFFNPDELAPSMVCFVGDRDLWKFSYKDTEAYCAALGVRPKFLDVWHACNSPVMRDILIREGETLLQSKNSQIEQLLKNVRWIWVAGHRVPVCNVPGFLASEVGNAIVRKYLPPFSCTYFDSDTNRIWSLRSSDEGLAINNIAETMRGGGHRNAAGFVTELNFMFPRKQSWFTALINALIKVVYSFRRNHD